MQALIAVITALTIVIAVMNILGGVVSGIWLAILGQWNAVGIGIACFLASGVAIRFALMPSLLLAGPAVYCAEKGNRTGAVFFAFLNSVYSMGLVTLWCVGVLYFFFRMADNRSVIPILLWSYGVATEPWAWLAMKDQQAGGNEYSLFSTFLAQVAYLLAIIMIALARAALRPVVITFSAIMGVGMIFQLVVAFSGDNAIRAEYSSFEDAE